MLYGVNTSTTFFIGINPLIELLTALEKEISNIGSVKQNFQNIVALNLPKVTADGITKVDEYESTYKPL